MRFSPRDRVMVVAPHPDDETLGAGGLLQRATASGAPCRVVFVTDGDDNPWPQRVVERRVRIDAKARARWGARRRSEAYAALDALGIPRRSAVFFGFPDQGLTHMLVETPGEVTARLGAELGEWRPTVLVIPSLRDRHPDHNAIAVAALETLARLAADERPIVLTYVVHPVGARLARDEVRLHLTSDEQARKRAAVERHETQLVFHGRSYRRAAAPVERFAMLASAPRADVRPRIARATLAGGVLRVELAPWRLPLRPVGLLVVGWDAARRHVALRLDLARGRRALMVRDARSRLVVARARREHAAGNVCVVASLPPHATRLAQFFVKLTARPSFFDRDGWTVGVVERRGAAPAERHLAPERYAAAADADARPPRVRRAHRDGARAPSVGGTR